MEKIADKLFREKCLIENYVYYIDDAKKIQIDASCILNKPVDILVLTHFHWDHILYANKIKKKTGCKVFAHENAVNVLKNMGEETCMPYIQKAVKSIAVDETLKDGDVIDCGEFKLKVIETFGHTDSCISLCEEKKKILFTGDVWFRDDVYGRCDLPTSDYSALKKSIDKLRKLDIKLLCSGHDY